MKEGNSRYDVNEQIFFVYRRYELPPRLMKITSVMVMIAGSGIIVVVIIVVTTLLSLLRRT
jgi:hypothetical protein